MERLLYDLVCHLIDMLPAGPPKDEEGCYWLMSQAWYDFLKEKIQDNHRFLTLYGYPVKVDDTAGFPVVIIKKAETGSTVVNDLSGEEIYKRLDIYLRSQNKRLAVGQF
jgi:hypothetical protein